MSSITMTTDEIREIVYNAYSNAAKIVRKMHGYPANTIADALDAVASTSK